MPYHLGQIMLHAPQAGSSCASGGRSVGTAPHRHPTHHQHDSRDCCCRSCNVLPLFELVFATFCAASSLEGTSWTVAWLCRKTPFWMAVTASRVWWALVRHAHECPPQVRPP